MFLCFALSVAAVTAAAGAGHPDDPLRPPDGSRGQSLADDCQAGTHAQLRQGYKVEWSQLRASDIAFKAFQANQVDMISTNANASIVAASKGVDMKIIASLSRETANGAHTISWARWMADRIRSRT